MKKIIITISIFILATIAFADELTINSYYPIPYSKYSNIRLVPRASLSDPCDIGMLYVNTAGELKYCRDNGSGIGTWGTFSGAWSQSGDNLFPTDTATNPNIKVGIGTDSPVETIHVEGDGGILIENDEVTLSFIDSGGGTTGEDDFQIISDTGDVLKIQGDSGSGWTDAMAFKSDGKVGIKTTTPTHKFHINDGIILAEGSLYNGDILATSGSGTRMFWYPRKAAFRAGYADGTKWDDANLGDHSTAFGIGTLASGTSSIALGYYTSATGTNSIAMGRQSLASGLDSIATGLSTQATSDNSIAMINGSTATSDNTLAIGEGADATGYSSTALGYGTAASGEYSLAMGKNTTSGTWGVAIGNGTSSVGGSSSLAMGSGTLASGSYSVAMGKNTIASSSYSIAMGYGIKSNGGCVLGIALNDQTGTVISTDNTMVIMGGKVGIGLVAPTEALHVQGNIKATGTITPGSSRTLKKDITPLSLEDARLTLNELQPITFQYKEEKNNDLHVGFIAEDVPDLVSIPDRKGISSMDIIATLTKVVQGQKEQIKKQNDMITEQEIQIQKLEALINEL